MWFSTAVNNKLPLRRVNRLKGKPSRQYCFLIKYIMQRFKCNKASQQVTSLITSTEYYTKMNVRDMHKKEWTRRRNQWLQLLVVLLRASCVKLHAQCWLLLKLCYLLLSFCFSLSAKMKLEDLKENTNIEVGYQTYYL